MFNQYLELTEENADIIIANSVIENLKFIVVSLDAIFGGQMGEEFFSEDYTFYFYHLQNTFTSCGNIINVFSGNLKRDRRYSYRARHLQECFEIDPKEYKWLFNKSFRNANEHFDERYDIFNGLVGDYNVITKKTRPEQTQEILRKPHIRTLDTRNWTYLTYDKNGNQICCNLTELRDEAYDLLFKISTHPRVCNTHLTHIPTKKIIRY